MVQSPKRISVLGSTGFIGCQAIEVIERSPDRFAVAALATRRNVALLSEQALRLRPSLAVVYEEERLPDLEQRLAGSGIRVAAGPKALLEAATLEDSQMLLLAMSGTAGLRALLEAIRARKQIALANKEPLVSAGRIVMRAAEEAGVRILPVDSEHSAVFQALEGHDRASVTRIILTASGGALRDLPLEELERVTPAQALEHPTWNMSSKITIDSATLMNKGMEVIEAHWLFGADFDRIEVVLHRQSVIHSMVEFCDGSVIAQMSPPDMRVPIQYALGYPERVACPWVKMDFTKESALTFEPVDVARCPCLELACRAGRMGQTYPAVMTGADEKAVELFLEGRIPFTGIARLIETALEEHEPVCEPGLEDILNAEQEGRSCAEREG